MLLAHPFPSRAYFSKLGRPFFFRSWVEAAAPSVRLGPLSPTTWETTCTRAPILLKRPLFFSIHFKTFQNIQNICLLQPGGQAAPGNPSCSKDPSSFLCISKHFKIFKIFVSYNLGDNLHPGAHPAQKTSLLLKAFHNISILFKIFQNIRIFKKI